MASLLISQQGPVCSHFLDGSGMRDDHEGQNTQLHVPSSMFLIGPTLARFKLLAIHLLSSVGLPFIYQFHPLSDHQPSKRTRGKVKKTRKGNKRHGLRKNHRPRRRARRHMSGNKIPNASVSLRLCQSASLPSVVYCLRTLLPFRLCTMYTNTHKADYRLEVKNRDR